MGEHNPSFMDDKNPSFLIAIRCFGAFEMQIQNMPVTAFATDKGRALLAYLALEADQLHRRERLASLLWPEASGSTGLTNLRITLHRLRQTLDEVAPGVSERWLISTRHTLRIDPAGMRVDVDLFQRLLAACTTHRHVAVTQCDECLARFAQAVELYRGELLAGLGLADAPDFEEWLLLRREALHQQLLAALGSLIHAYEQRGDQPQAHTYASRQMALDPYREEAHRQLMLILARRGLVTEALAQYERCRRLLLEELGVELAFETVALYDQIRNGELAALAGGGAVLIGATIPPPLPNSSPAPTDWGDAPELAKVYGREAELAQLVRWLVPEGRPANSPPDVRLIAILGIGGMGKTTLAAALIRAVGARFDRVIWRSVLNAPPPDELLRDLLQTLTNQHLTELPSGLDAQLALLLDLLRQQRCLLVLDNLESILQPDQPGQMRPGYAGYAQLMQWIVDYRHQSCLLLTSRERPLGLARREEDLPQVRTLELEGLDVTAGQAMLSARGLTGPMVDAVTLVARYSGNPLALKLVAQTVQELFSGDIAAFLAIEAPIFDDIRTVLDQQFARLSPLEQELLIWMAIEREPIAIQPLRANLVQLPSSRALIEGVRALQRRSLVMQSATGFLLQNVVTEYLTDYLIEAVCRAAEESGGERESSPPASARSVLNQYALLKATAKEEVRASQVRLILQPIATCLLARLGQTGLSERAKQILASLRSQVALTPGYTAGNLLNLLLHLGIDLNGYDFSHLNIWHAYLQGKRLPGVNFSGANLAHSSFTYVFGDILAIHFDAAGQLLVAGLIHGKLCPWRAQGTPAAGQLLREYQNFGAGAIIASFSTDGARLITADTDHHVRVWDVAQGQSLHTLAGHNETPWIVRFSSDGQTAASSGAGGIVQIWDVKTGSLRQTLQGHPAAVQGLALTSDGAWLASGHIDGAVSLWRVGDEVAPRHILSGHSDVAAALVFDGTGTILASGSHDCTIRLWDVESGATRAILRTHTRKIRWLAMSADGYTLASGGHDNFVCLWDVREPAPSHDHLLHTLLGHDYSLYHLAFRADGRTLATVGIDQTIYLWDVVTGQRQDRLQVYRSEVHMMDFSPDGRWLASGGDDSIVHLWDVAAALSRTEPSAEPVRQSFYGHTRSIYALAFHPTHDWVASAGREPAISLWRTSDGRLIRTLAGHTDDIKALHFSPDGQRLVSASRDKTVCIWEIPSAHNTGENPGRPRFTLQGHTDQVLTCTFSPDGQLIASGGYDRTICLWDADGGRLIRTLIGHTHGVRSVDFSPDGTLLISSGYDRTLRLWEVQSGQMLYGWPPQNSLILRAIFHPNGALLATGASDHSVRLWDVTSAKRGQLLVTLRGHTDLVGWICFSPDGQWLASCGTDETIRLWDVTAALAASTGKETACVATLRPAGPYAGMNIAGVTGISEAQRAALLALGAVEE